MHPSEKMDGFALSVTGMHGLDDLHIIPQKAPVPTGDQVVVRTEAAALNYRDVALLSGKSAGAAIPPYIPLSDACGIVHAVGPNVTDLTPGQRVCSSFFPDWLNGRPDPEKMTALGASGTGVGARYFILRQTALVPAPAHLSPIEAATLPCAGVTAWMSLFSRRDLCPGDTILLQGTGGVSLFALQFARAAGLRTIVTSSSDEKLERVKSMGATDTINYRRTPDWAEETLRLTSGRGVDLIIEVGGAQSLAQSLRAIRLDGSISVVGMLGDASAPLDIRAIYSRNAHIHGITVGPVESLRAMAQAIDTHRIAPVIGAVFSIHEARSAFKAMAAGNIFGKIVLNFEN